MNDSPQCEILGFVEDLRPLLSASHAFVNPIFGGGGTRLKVLTAMAMGCPVISTRIGAEGINVESGKSILFAEDEHEFARHIHTCIYNRKIAERLRTEGNRIIRERYGWESVVKNLENAISEKVQ